MEMLSIIIFYTIKGDETRAWPIIKGTHVLDAAGLIHSDMKDGFIRAEVLEWKDFIAVRNLNKSDIQNDNFIELSSRLFKTATPYMKFLCEAMGVPY